MLKANSSGMCHGIKFHILGTRLYGVWNPAPSIEIEIGKKIIFFLCTFLQWHHLKDLPEILFYIFS